MGARTMAIICNLSYQAHIYTYFARLLNSTLGGGNFCLMGYGPKREKGPTRNGDNGLKFNTLRKSPVVLEASIQYRRLLAA
jgi:hypothetical protein